MSKDILVDLSSLDGIDIRTIVVPMRFVESDEEGPYDDFYYCAVCKKRLHGERVNDYTEKPHNLMQCLEYVIFQEEKQ